ncbi:MAG: hypothetical protein JW820_05435 [Spirochaetales bacterium]|nr:hypothetical protein [Spirochaetales bacterium]
MNRGLRPRGIPLLSQLIVLLAIPLLVLACLGPTGPEGEESDWPGGDGGYLELTVDNPPTPRLIQVHEYNVTSLEIQVFDPAGNLIQEILWLPAEGSKTYRIPAQREGEYEIVVTHVSTEAQEEIRATESEKFYIQRMKITVVDIIPGVIGFINIDGSAQQAIELVREELLPLALEQSKADLYVLRRMDGYLPAGTLIAEDNPDEGVAKESTFRLEEDSYLFFLDLEPGAFFEHPVKYLIVSTSGKTKMVDANWWPRVNDKIPEPFVADFPDTKYLVELNVTLVRPVVEAKEWLIKDPGILQLLKREAFLVVQGLLSDENLYACAVTSYNNAYAFFDTYRGSLSTIVGLHDYSADDVLTEIDSLVEGGYDIITIYILAHGGTDSVRLGGYSFWASQFASKMSSHPEVEFNFMLGSCHGGSFTDDLRALANVRVVETACAAAESAWPDWDSYGSLTDYNSSDNGSEWTSSIFEAASVIVNSATLWSVMTDRAAAYKVPKTSVLLNEAGYLSVALNRGLSTTLTNYDLTNRTGHATPQHYNSWEILY